MEIRYTCFDWIYKRLHSKARCSSCEATNILCVRHVNPLPYTQLQSGQNCVNFINQSGQCLTQKPENKRNSARNIKFSLACLVMQMSSFLPTLSGFEWRMFLSICKSGWRRWFCCSLSLLWSCVECRFISWSPQKDLVDTFQSSGAFVVS